MHTIAMVIFYVGLVSAPLFFLFTALHSKLLIRFPRIDQFFSISEKKYVENYFFTKVFFIGLCVGILLPPVVLGIYYAGVTVCMAWSVRKDYLAERMENAIKNIMES